MVDNKRKVLTNLIWRFAERMGAKLVVFIVSIVLARILSPEEYGTVALVSVFITLFQVFVDSGLGNALIQKKETDDLDFSTVFYTNMVFCFVLYIILFFVSPLIASFYNNSSLTLYIRVLGLTLIISGIKNVQQAYVSKKLIFKKFFFATLIGTITAAVVGIVMALKGFGIWALITQQLVNLFIDTLILWLTVKWRPKLLFSFERLKMLFSYGWKILVSSFIDTLYNDITQLIIGKKYSESDLAFYNKGNQMPNLLVTNINNSIDSVLLPTLSKEQDNIDNVRRMTRRAIKTSMYIMAPLMIGLVFTSNNVIRLLLTEKWIETVPYLCIFCFAYMFYPIHTANLNAIKSLGRSDIFLKLEIIKKVIGSILLVISMFIGVKAMAYSILINSIVAQFINSWPNKKLLNYGYFQQLKDILPSLLLALTMGIIVYVINYIPIPLLAIFIIQVVVGGTIYTVGSKIFRLDSYSFIINLIKGGRK